jgi:hypothetical protein
MFIAGEYVAGGGEKRFFVVSEPNPRAWVFIQRCMSERPDERRVL